MKGSTIGKDRSFALVESFVGEVDYHLLKYGFDEGARVYVCIHTKELLITPDMQA